MIYIYIHIQQFKFFKWIINIYNHAIKKYFKRSFQSNILNHKHVRINIRPRLRVIKHRARDFVRINAVPIKQAEKKALIRAKSKTRDGCLGPVTIRHFPLLRQSLSSARPYLHFVKGELLHTTNSPVFHGEPQSPDLFASKSVRKRRFLYDPTNSDWLFSNYLFVK